MDNHMMMAASYIKHTNMNVRYLNVRSIIVKVGLAEHVVSIISGLIVTIDLYRFIQTPNHFNV